MTGPCQAPIDPSLAKNAATIFQIRQQYRGLGAPGAGCAHSTLACLFQVLGRGLGSGLFACVQILQYNLYVNLAYQAQVLPKEENGRIG